MDIVDIDYMFTEDQIDMMKKGLCFKCGKPGHRAKDPQYHPEQQRGGYTSLQRPPQKMKGKELHTHVRMLLAQMEAEEKEDLFNDASKEGF